MPRGLATGEPGAEMNICPICLFVNGASAEACSRCGKFRFDGNSPAVAVADAPSRPDMNPPPLHDAASATRADRSNCVITKPSGAIKSAAQTRSLPPADGSGHDLPSTPISETTKPTRTILKPKLEVVRGERCGATFAVLEGKNVVGRTVNQPEACRICANWLSGCIARVVYGSTRWRRMILNGRTSNGCTI